MSKLRRQEERRTTEQQVPSTQGHVNSRPRRLRCVLAPARPLNPVTLRPTEAKLANWKTSPRRRAQPLQRLSWLAIPPRPTLSTAGPQTFLTRPPRRSQSRTRLTSIRRSQARSRASSDATPPPPAPARVTDTSVRPEIQAVEDSIRGSILDNTPNAGKDAAMGGFVPGRGAAQRAIGQAVGDGISDGAGAVAGSVRTRVPGVEGAVIADRDVKALSPIVAPATRLILKEGQQMSGLLTAPNAEPPRSGASNYGYPSGAAGGAPAANFHPESYLPPLSFPADGNGDALPAPDGADYAPMPTVLPTAPRIPRAPYDPQPDPSAPEKPPESRALRMLRRTRRRRLAPSRRAPRNRSRGICSSNTNAIQKRRHESPPALRQT